MEIGGEAQLAPRTIFDRVRIRLGAQCGSYLSRLPADADAAASSCGARREPEPSRRSSRYVSRAR
jgi:hypothetical protein